MADSDGQIHLAVALRGAGWHPGAWRDKRARPHDLYSAKYWVELAQEAERGLLDFVTLEDSLGLYPKSATAAEPRTDRVAGSLEAIVVANRIGPSTQHIGIVPTAIVTHTEPFHISKAVATLDFVTEGRAGVRLQLAADAQQARLFGRRKFPEIADISADTPAVAKLTAELFSEARDYAEVIRRLWDSWDDDAEIRDAGTGRFIDRDRLHYIDFEGEHFSVRGPSITPRPPQGQPPVAALGHAEAAYQLIARQADIGFITADSAADADAIADGIAVTALEAGRDQPKIFVDLGVLIADTHTRALARRDELDKLAGQSFADDAPFVAGTAAQVADRIVELTAGAQVAGVRLRPAVLPVDLVAITTELVPHLQHRGIFRTEYQGKTLRDHLGLARPHSRYTNAAAAESVV